MPTTYSKCGDDVNEIVESVIASHHPRLAKVGVTVGCLFAASDTGEAVKLHGYACAAVIRKTNLKERTVGLPDAQIIIDLVVWEGLSADQQEALIDHELTHLVPQVDDQKKVKLDDQGRPKLKMRLHDAQVGIFKEVIERHGRNALDGDIARKFIKDYQQLVLWAEEPAHVG